MVERPVTVNVGGTFFTSNLKTWTLYSDSKLAAMIVEYEQSSRDDGSSLFIDRDPISFRHILNFLRNGRLLLPDDFNEFEILRQEAAHYELFDLIWKLPPPPPPREQEGASLHPPCPQVAGGQNLGQSQLKVATFIRTTDFVFVRSSKQRSFDSYNKWTFEAPEHVLCDIKQIFPEGEPKLENPKHLQGAMAYKLHHSMNVVTFSKGMADLGFILHSSFELERIKMRRFYVRYQL